MTRKWSVLRGLGAALRFSMIPLFCAAVVALASEDPRGRILAMVAGAAVVFLGVAVTAREIIGRRGEPRRDAPRAPLSTGEWMAQVQ